MGYGLHVRGLVLRCGQVRCLILQPIQNGPIFRPIRSKTSIFLSSFFLSFNGRLRENSNRIPKSFAGDPTPNLDRKSVEKQRNPKGTSKAIFSFFPSFLIPSDQYQREQIRSRCRNCGRLTGVSSPSPRCTRRGRGVRRQLHPIGVGSRGADNFGPRSHLGATGRCACRGLPRPLDPGNAARRLAPRALPLPAPCRPPRLHR